MGQLLDTFATDGIDTSQFLLFGPSGNIFVTTQLADGVAKIDGTTGSLITTFGGVSNAQGLSIFTEWRPSRCHGR
jgi:hypothetical protein